MAKKAAAKPANKLPLRPLAAAIGTLALAVGGYFAVVWLGQQASEAIAGRPRYQVRFEEIQCAVPPGMDRASFLAEVRYLGNPPMEFSSADGAIPKKLSEAFAKHPWVAAAVPSETTPAWPSPVNLVFRTPALAVKVDAGHRVVDANAILLPSAASAAGLPVLATPQTPPGISAGEKWINTDVRRAIDLAKDYDATTLEKTTTGWRITQRTGRILTIGR